MKILVVAKEMAIYRAELLQQIYGNLPVGSEITIMHADTIIPECGWANPEDVHEYDMRFRHVEPSVNNGIVKKLFRKFFSVHSQQMKSFPTEVLVDYGVPDILWVHEINEYTLPVILKLKKKAKIVLSTEVGRDKTIVKYNFTTYWTHRIIGRYIDGVVGRSQSAFFTPVIKSKPIVFAPYGINTSNYKVEKVGEPSEKCRMIFVGQFIHRKGIDLLASACELLVKKGVTNFEVTVVGKGDDEIVNSEIRNRNLGAYMVNHGFCMSKDLPKLYAQSDVFVFPTRSDTHAVVIHEAASCGLAMLVSQFAGASSLIVEDGKSGFIIDPHDTENFANKMSELINNRDLVDSMGVEAEIRAKELCVTSKGRDVAKFLLEL